jgi:hypothetical protein
MGKFTYLLSTNTIIFIAIIISITSRYVARQSRARARAIYIRPHWNDTRRVTNGLWPISKNKK